MAGLLESVQFGFALQHGPEPPQVLPWLQAQPEVKADITSSLITYFTMMIYSAYCFGKRKLRLAFDYSFYVPVSDIVLQSLIFMVTQINDLISISIDQEIIKGGEIARFEPFQHKSNYMFLIVHFHYYKIIFYLYTPS